MSLKKKMTNMENQEIEIIIHFKDQDKKYGVRAEFKHFQDLLDMIRNTANLVMKENKTPEDIELIKKYGL